MAQKKIKIYARIKPERCVKQTLYEIHDSNIKEELVIYPPRSMNQSITNSPYKYTFHFDKIFKSNSEQMEIFETVALPVLERVKEGSNGTILAYGQTGSGKTFTMLGSIPPNSYRGVIPRILQNIFNDENTIRVSLSYLEIYKDVGVDLLSRNCQKVIFQEDNTGIHLKDLQKVYVQDMSEAIRILQIGEENRRVSCTKYNTRSSRSHCILTVSYEGSHGGKIVQSYLHLVDLAGSERFKAHLRATDESIHINKSLHFLEVVINALTHPTLRHIPYRNCLVTSVLKESLNANSHTSMIATLSMAESNAFETLSSCRFASRMSKIKSRRVEVGKENKVDRRTQMLSLQDEVQRLHGLLVKVSNVKSDVYNNDLTDEDKRYCEAVVSKFLSEDNDATSIPVTQCKHIQECFRIIRKRVKEFQKQVHHRKSKEDSEIFTVNGEEKTDFTTTYTQEFTHKSKEKTIPDNKSYNKSYDERPIRTCTILPEDTFTNRKKERNNMLKTKNDGTINFDKYLEQSLHNRNCHQTSYFFTDRSSKKSSTISANCTPSLSTFRSNKGSDSLSANKLTIHHQKKKSILKTKIHTQTNDGSMGQIQNHCNANFNEFIPCSHIHQPIPSSNMTSHIYQRQNELTHQPCYQQTSDGNNCIHYYQQIPSHCLRECHNHSENAQIHKMQICRNQTCEDQFKIISNTVQSMLRNPNEHIGGQNVSEENNDHLVDNKMQDSWKIESDIQEPEGFVYELQFESLAEPCQIQRQSPRNNICDGTNINASHNEINANPIPCENSTPNKVFRSLENTSLPLDKQSAPAFTSSTSQTFIPNPFYVDVQENFVQPRQLCNTEHNPKPYYDTPTFVDDNSVKPYDIHWISNRNLETHDADGYSGPTRDITFSDTSPKHYVLPGTASKVPLTGDKEIDEEIIKFYKCRELASMTKI